MSFLVGLLEVPKSDLEWQRWSFWHRNDHDFINQTINTQQPNTLPVYELDPINFAQFAEWTARNQQSHNDNNGALQTQGQDLSTLNLQDENEKQAWFWTHYQEHFNWHVALKV